MFKFFKNNSLILFAASIFVNSAVAQTTPDIISAANFYKVKVDLVVEAKSDENIDEIDFNTRQAIEVANKNLLPLNFYLSVNSITLVDEVPDQGTDTLLFDKSASNEQYSGNLTVYLMKKLRSDRLFGLTFQDTSDSRDFCKKSDSVILVYNRGSAQVGIKSTGEGIAHEFGHRLGLEHSENGCGKEGLQGLSLMYPRSLGSYCGFSSEQEQQIKATKQTTNLACLELGPLQLPQIQLTGPDFINFDVSNGTAAKFTTTGSRSKFSIKEVVAGVSISEFSGDLLINAGLKQQFQFTVVAEIAGASTEKVVTAIPIDSRPIFEAPVIRVSAGSKGFKRVVSAQDGEGDEIRISCNNVRQIKINSIIAPKGQAKILIASTSSAGKAISCRVKELDNSASFSETTIVVDKFLKKRNTNKR